MTRSTMRTTSTRAVALSVCCLAGLMTAQPGPVDAAGAATGAARACAWKTVAAPTPGVGSAALNGVDAIAPKDIWAVGYSNAQGKTLAEHWNGKKWSVVKTPNKSGFTAFQDVAVVSHRNVWAVGYFVPSGGSHPRTLIEHWNGKRWRIVKSPNPLKGTNVLFGVDAASARAVFAVGTNNLGASAGLRQVTLRLTPKGWKSVKAGPSSGAEDVAVFSAKSALAVGHIGSGTASKPLVEKYAGGHWTRLATSTSATGPDLADLSARGSDVQWAVGDQSGTSALQTFTMRKTGAGWVTVPSADSAPSQVNVLHGVAALSKGEAWAVGYHETSSFVPRTLIEHFKGGSWSIVPSPNGSTMANELLDITARRGQLWAVGYASRPLGSKVLIEARRC
jgi:hypothetical protein